MLGIRVVVAAVAAVAVVAMGVDFAKTGGLTAFRRDADKEMIAQTTTTPSALTASNPGSVTQIHPIAMLYYYYTVEQRFLGGTKGE